MDYDAVIGLEIHVQLKTQSKMWCGCANALGSPPNTHVCPACLGLPGVMPGARTGLQTRPRRVIGAGVSTVQEIVRERTDESDR